MSREAIGVTTRLPRLGKIRLGVMKQGRRGKFPSAVDHFVFDEQVPELAELYGDDCRVIPNVMIPAEEEQTYFQLSKSAYTKSGLFCRSWDGQNATRVRVEPKEGGKSDTQGERFIKEQGLDVAYGQMYDLPCPGEECHYYRKGYCSNLGRLFFFVLDSPKFGVYEISTTSINSIRNVLSSVEAIQQTAGRITSIPMNLKLVPMKVSPEGKAKTVYVLELEFAGGGIRKLLQVAQTVPESRQLVGAPEPVPDDDVPGDLMPNAGQDLGEQLGQDAPVDEGPPLDPDEMFGEEPKGDPDLVEPAPAPAQEQREATAQAALQGNRRAAKQAPKQGPKQAPQKPAPAPPPAPPANEPKQEDFFDI